MDLGFALPHGPQCRGLTVTQNAYFSHLTHSKKLSLVTFCDPTGEYEVSVWTHRKNVSMDRQTDGQTDVEVEIVI